MRDFSAFVRRNRPEIIPFGSSFMCDPDNFLLQTEDIQTETLQHRCTDLSPFRSSVRQKSKPITFTIADKIEYIIPVSGRYGVFFQWKQQNPRIS